MWRCKSIFFPLILACVLPGCGLFKKKKTPESKTTLVGIVEMVNPEQNYVLIRCDQMLALAGGAELIAVDATGSESKLKLTPERKGRYLTADITQGTPKVMNLVIHRKRENTPLNPSSGPIPLPSPAPGNSTPPSAELPQIPPLSLEPLPSIPAQEPLAVPSELPPAVQ